MAMTFMWNAAGSPEVKTEVSFTDVAEDAGYRGPASVFQVNGVSLRVQKGDPYVGGPLCRGGEVFPP